LDKRDTGKNKREREKKRLLLHSEFTVEAAKLGALLHLHLIWLVGGVGDSKEKSKGGEREE
jgi:hypothetical protein